MKEQLATYLKEKVFGKILKTDKMKINDRKPILFEKSDHNIWTDPYIQQQMLKKHLDLHSDEASRRQEYTIYSQCIQQCRT